MNEPTNERESVSDSKKERITNSSKPPNSISLHLTVKHSSNSFPPTAGLRIAPFKASTHFIGESHGDTKLGYERTALAEAATYGI